MKILHTADWHIGKRLKNFSRLNEQNEVLEEITGIAESENVDAVIIAGDIFDTFNPPIEATELYYRTIKALAKNGARPVVVIAGNHDSPDRIQVSDPLARECGIILAGYPHTLVRPLCLISGLQILRSDEGFIELLLPGYDYPLRILHTSYANEYRLKTYLGCDNTTEKLSNALRDKWQALAEKYCDDKGVNIVAAHLFMAKKGAEEPEESDEERSIRLGGADVIYTEILPGNIHYAALGHIHKHWIIDKDPCPVVYSGSPLCYGLSESGQKKYVVIIEADPNPAGQQAAAGSEAKNFDVAIKRVELASGKKILRHEFEDIDKAVDWLTQNQDALVELTIVSDTFLTSADQKRLHRSHEGIIGIVPKVKGYDINGSSQAKDIELTKSIEELFVDYFMYKNQGQEPNEDLIRVFREITQLGE